MNLENRDAEIRIDDICYIVDDKAHSPQSLVLKFSNCESTYLNDAGERYDNWSILYDRAFNGSLFYPSEEPTAVSTAAAAKGAEESHVWRAE